MGLSRRQVRLLSISAGDHERMPKTEKDKDEETINLLKDGKPVKQEIPENILKRLRKGVAKPGKFATFGEKKDKDVKMSKIDKMMKDKNIDKDMKELLSMAKHASSGIKVK